MKLHKVSSILFVLLCFCHISNNYARGGDSKRGGGFGEDGKLFDFSDARKRGKVIIEDVKSLRGYNKYVDPLLEKLYTIHGLFAEDLERFFHEKSWWYVGSFSEEVKKQFESFQKKMKNSEYRQDLKRVGFQDENDIELLEGWHKTAPEFDAAGLIGHELVVGLIQELFPDKSDEEIQKIAEKINEVLFLDKSLNTKKLLKRLKGFGVEKYTLKNKEDYRTPKKFKKCRLYTYLFLEDLMYLSNADLQFRLALQGFNYGRWHGLKMLTPSELDYRTHNHITGYSILNVAGINKRSLVLKCATKKGRDEVKSMIKALKEYHNTLMVNGTCPKDQKLANISFIDEFGNHKEVSSENIEKWCDKLSKMDEARFPKGVENKR